MIQIKNAKELDGMRKANALSAAALKYGGEHIEAGMTTWELDKLIYDFIVKHGGTPNFKGLYGFPGTACISLNDTIIMVSLRMTSSFVPVISSASTPAQKSMASTATMPAPMRWARSIWKHSACWM